MKGIYFVIISLYSSSSIPIYSHSTTYFQIFCQHKFICPIPYSTFLVFPFPSQSLSPPLFTCCVLYVLCMYTVCLSEFRIPKIISSKMLMRSSIIYFNQPYTKTLYFSSTMLHNEERAFGCAIRFGI